MTELNDVPSDGNAGSNVDDLLARLRARVESRLQSGAYPPGLEEEMSAHFQRILHQRHDTQPLPDLFSPLKAVAQALSLEASRIPADSGLPGGQAVHKAIARIVGRQTQGILQQVQGFARPVYSALEALTQAVQELNRVLQVEVAQSLDAIYERQAAQERMLAGLGLTSGQGQASPLNRWYSAERFEKTFRGPQEESVENYRRMAERLEGCSPVVDIGCGRGEFLEILTGLGVDAWGVDIDGEIVKVAVDRKIRVEHGEALSYLRRLDDNRLGGLSLIHVIEHLSAQEIVYLVALAADKVRIGGRVFVETANRPFHPAYLTFLFRESGFSEVDVEWRSPALETDNFEAPPEDSSAAAVHRANVRRLNELLFAPQDCLVVATR